MNERIWDFVRQAEDHANSNVHLIGWNYAREYNNKFAELIVLESINGLLNSYGPDDCLPQEEIAGFLKNHFGVE